MIAGFPVCAPLLVSKAGAHRFAQSHEQQYASTSVFPYTGVWRQIAVDLRAILRETGGKCIPYSTDPPQNKSILGSQYR